MHCYSSDCDAIDISELQFRLLFGRIHQALTPAKPEQIRCNLAHLYLFTTLRDAVSAMMSPDMLKGEVP